MSQAALSAKDTDAILKTLEHGEPEIAEDLAKARDVAKLIFHTADPTPEMVFGVFDRMCPSNMARIDTFRLGKDLPEDPK